MGWSKKYKRSIDCNNPKGFSQKAHCAGRKKRENVMSSKLEELVGKPITEEQFDEAAGKKDACYHKVKARYDVWPSAYASGALVKCRKVGAANWGNKSKKEGLDDLKALPKDLKKSIKKKREEGLGDRMSKKLKKLKGVNLKKKKVKRLKLKGRGVYQDYDGLKEDVFIETNTNGKMKTTHVYYESDGKGYGYTLEFVNELNEAEYQGRKVKLGKIMQGDTKKFKVYVKNEKGNVVKVNFGDPNMRIRKSNPKARKSFRARHNCDNPGPKWKARYWSCKMW